MLNEDEYEGNLDDYENFSHIDPDDPFLSEKSFEIINSVFSSKSKSDISSISSGFSIVGSSMKMSKQPTLVSV